MASVTRISRSSGGDTDTSFEKLRRAGLVNSRFAIDGRQPFWGYHDSERRWNGWATPGFVRHVVDLIANWVNHDEPGTAWWEGDVLHVRGGDGEFVDEIAPDELGVYRFNGWIWLEADEQI